MRRYVTLVLLALAGCGGPAPAPAPDDAAKAGPAADPAPPERKVLSYTVELAFGHRMDLSGQVTDQESFGWQDASGKTHKVEAPAEAKPLAEGVCIYLETGADKKPVIPLKVIVIDFLEYCAVGPGAKIFSGSVKEERETKMIEDGKPVAVKSTAVMLESALDPVP